MWLLLSAASCLAGLALGALVMFVAVLISASAPNAADDRNRLIEILKGNKVSDETVIKVLREGGDTLWARLRLKTRPMLWRYGYDWPEFAPLLETDLQDYFSGLIPASPPSFAPLTAPEDILRAESESGLMDLPDAFLPPNLSDTPELENGPDQV